MHILRNALSNQDKQTAVAGGKVQEVVCSNRVNILTVHWSQKSGKGFVTRYAKTATACIPRERTYTQEAEVYREYNIEIRPQCNIKALFTRMQYWLIIFRLITTALLYEAEY